MRSSRFLTAFVFCLGWVSLVAAADNELTSDEEKSGWQLLFNGRDTTGWKCNDGKPIASPVEDGTLTPYKSGGYLIIHQQQFGDFVLRCDVRWEEEGCNSGVFFRVEDPQNPVHTGFELQVMGRGRVGKHALGAIYELAGTTKNAGKKTGEWNRIEIRCVGPYVDVKVNGQEVASMNCDDFDQPGLCPDGEGHKFKLAGQPRAVKDFARVGYLGFQDHGHQVWFKNVKLLKLD